MNYTELVESLTDKLLEGDISKYPTEPWGTKVNFDNVPGYDSERRDRDKEAAQFAAAKHRTNFDSVVDEIMTGVDTNLNNPTVAPEEKEVATHWVFK